MAVELKGKNSGNGTASGMGHVAAEKESRPPLFSSGAPGETPTSLEQILYRDQVIEGLSVRETAALYGLASSDVLASRERVTAWLAATMPASRLAHQQQRVMIQKVTIDRLEYVYGEAMGAWRDSREATKVTKQPTYLPSENTTTTTSSPRPRGSLLAVAARIVALMGRIQMAWVDENERRAGENNPDRACSPFRGDQRDDAANPGKIDDASQASAIGYDQSPSMLTPPLSPANPRARPVQAATQGGVSGGSPLAAGPAQTTPEKPKPIIIDSIVMHPSGW